MKIYRFDMSEYYDEYNQIKLQKLLSFDDIVGGTLLPVAWPALRIHQFDVYSDTTRVLVIYNSFSRELEVRVRESFREDMELPREVLSSLTTYVWQRKEFYSVEKFTKVIDEALEKIHMIPTAAAFLKKMSSEIRDKITDFD